MNLGCPCGNVLTDNTDWLPYKGRFISDLDTEMPIDLVRDMMRLLELPDAKSRRDFLVSVRARFDGLDFATGWIGEVSQYADLKEALETLAFAYWHRYDRVMYECEECGRLLLPTNSGRYVSYLPETKKRGVLKAWEPPTWNQTPD